MSLNFESQNNMKQALPMVSFFSLFQCVLWCGPASTTQGTDTSWAQTPLAPWQHYRRPPEMQACVLSKNFHVRHLDSFHPALYTSLSPLCCVFPGCWRADCTTRTVHTRSTQTNPEPDPFSSLSVCFSLPCCFLPILAAKTSLHSPHCA